jgi:hypothetical protein
VNEQSVLWKGRLEQESFMIIFKINEEPRKVRIWNGSEPLLSSIKDIQIYLNRMLLASAKVPLGFGIVIDLGKIYDQKDTKRIYQSNILIVAANIPC